jgi:two-component system, chemotaxis family, protein-glutamate methylesterase/glutaminase
MYRKIKVLVVDDSTVVRRLLSDAIASDEGIDVVGVAANGKIALAKIPQLNPDVITLDIEMPEMDGLQTLVELRKLYPTLPVIMFSTLTQSGAEATLKALSLGANDYVTKPSNVGGVDEAALRIRNELCPRIKMLCSWFQKQTSQKTDRLIRNGESTTTSLARSSSVANRSKRNPKCRVDAVVIGVSTGGPNALQTLIPALPASLPVPVFIVQHMPPIFTKHLAERLNQLSPLEVHEARHGDTVRPGGVWLAPGDFHMTLARLGTSTKVSLNKDTPECSCRPAVDVLFRSASAMYGKNLLAVVLTGMGQDGLRGCDAVNMNGGRILTQDEQSCVVYGMPAAVQKAGLSDLVLPLHRIAHEIIDACNYGRVLGRSLATAQ